MKRTECQGMMLPHWPKGKKFKGNYWKADPVTAPKSGPEVNFTFTPKPPDLTPDEERAWLWHADKFGPSRAFGPELVASLRRKMAPDYVSKAMRKEQQRARVEAKLKARAEKRKAAAAPIEPSAVERKAPRVPQLPAMAGMAPLGIAPNKFRAACLKPFTDAVAAMEAKETSVATVDAVAPFQSSIATLEKRIMENRKPFEGDTVSVPRVRTSPSVKPAVVPGARVKSRLEQVATTDDKDTASSKVPIVPTSCTQAKIDEVKRLEALAEQVNADLKSARAMLFPDLERARLEYARKTRAFLSSIHPDGLAHKTFTSRHSHNSTMSDVEADAFYAAAAAAGIDASKYLAPVYTVDCECSDFASPDTVLALLEHGGRITVELPKTAPDDLVDTLQATLPPKSIVATIKTAKILHHDYTMDAGVEAVVNACAGMKAVQPVLYFAK